MSSVITAKTGLRRIEVILDGHRRRIRLGRMSLKDASAVQVRIDAIVRARDSHRRDVQAEQWLLGLHPKLIRRLIAAGVLPQTDSETLKGLVDKFFASRTHVKASTTAADHQATDSLLAYFGEKRNPRTITERHGQEWRESLLADLAEATIAKRVMKARCLFASAVRWGMADLNPFSNVRTGSQENKSRIRLIDSPTAHKVLDACPNAEWRAIVALARWGGLRIPSELVNLRWADVLFDEKKLHVHSPKTEHHKGGEERWMVLLPEVEHALLEYHGEAETGAEFIFSAKRRTSSNLRTNMERIVRRAGLTPWPKLFHNLRASLQTELTMQHPLHVVCNWLGNSPKVAEAHYLSVPDSVFKYAAQIAAQQSAASGGTDEQKDGANIEITADNAVSQDVASPLPPIALRKSLHELFEKHGCGAKCGALADAVIQLLSRPQVAGRREQ